MPIMHATNCCVMQAVLYKHTIAYTHVSADYINNSIFSCALPLFAGPVWFHCSLGSLKTIKNVILTINSLNAIGLKTIGCATPYIGQKEN